jgi:ABC-2 type transport system permease protein
MIDTLRALTTGQDAGSDLWLAVGWCLLIALAGYLWSRRLFTKVPKK